MEYSSQFALRGLFLVLIIACFSVLRVDAQVLKGINDAVKTATEPAKDASKIVKEAAQPAKDANKAIKTVTNAPEKVGKEYEKVGNEVERTEKEYEKMTGQVKKSSGDDDKKETKAADSTATKSAGADTKSTEGATHTTATPPDFQPKPQPQPTPVTVKKVDPPADLPRPVPPGSRDNKTASGPLPTTEATPDKSPSDSAPAPLTDSEITARETAAANNSGSIDSGFHVASDGKNSETPAETETPIVTETPLVSETVTSEAPVPNADSLQGVAPKESEVADDPVAKTAETPVASGTEAGTAVGDENAQAVAPVVKPPITYPVPGGGERRPKQDYSKSPARIQLEQAEYDVETLEDIFRYSAWDGPERDHTVRAVAFALDELQAMIVEIKKIDPGQSTWRFEETYKDMKAAYLEEMKRARDQQGE